MRYEYMKDSLRPEAPIGLGGTCPICDGELDGIVWAMSVGGKNECHEERCKKCCSLINLKNGKVDNNNYKKSKQNYKKYLERKNERDIKIKADIKKLKKTKNNFFIKTIFLGKKQDIDFKIKELIFKMNNNNFSRFRTY